MKLALEKSAMQAGGMSIRTALSVSRPAATAFVALGMFWGGFAAYVPEIKAGLGASDALFGTLLLGSAVGLVSAMWVAPHVDRVLGARGMQVGAALLALFWLIPGQMTSPFLFAVSMAFVGLASGVLDVVMNARVSELEAKHARPLMNVNHAMFSVSYAASAIVVSFTRDAGIGPLPVFAGLTALALLMLPLMRLEVKFVAAEEGYSGHYPLAPILLCGGVVLIAFLSEATVEAWSALHIERTLNGAAAQGALGPAMLGITMAIGRFSGQAVSERLDEFTVVICATMVSAFGAAIAALAPTPLVAYVGFGVLGLGVSVIGPIGLALVGRLVAPHLRTEAISRAAVMGFSGFFIAPILMGFLSEAFGLRFAFLSVAGLLLAALPLTIWIKRLPQHAAR